MNKIMLTGRLTKAPEVRYSVGENPQAVARYSIAVNRNRKNQDGNYEADFFNLVCFGKMAEFVEKYFKKGTKIEAVGRVQTSTYTNREGVKMPSFTVVVEEQNFAESKSSSGGEASTYAAPEAAVSETTDDGFMPFPDDDEELPFN